MDVAVVSKRNEAVGRLYLFGPDRRWSTGLSDRFKGFEAFVVVHVIDVSAHQEGHISLATNRPGKYKSGIVSTLSTPAWTVETQFMPCGS